LPDISTKKATAQSTRAGGWDVRKYNLYWNDRFVNMTIIILRFVVTEVTDFYALTHFIGPPYALFAGKIAGTRKSFRIIRLGY
jgi:hypothetical protein